MRVLISGGGVGGLCLAQGLQKQGVEAIVFERDPGIEFRNQGYRLYINPDGHGALAACLPSDLYQLFVATSFNPSPRMAVFDEQLRPRGVTALPPLGRSNPYDRHAAVNRLTLREILANGLPDLRFSTRIDSYSIGRSKVRVRLADGSTVDGDVLVGADGIRSVVRRQYLPTAGLADIGLRVIYGKISVSTTVREALPEHFLSDLFTAVVGADKKFLGVAPVLYPAPFSEALGRICPGMNLREDHDYLMCLLGARREAFDSDDQMQSLGGRNLRHLGVQMIDAWHPLLRELVGQWDENSLFFLRPYSSIPVDPWPPSQITLIGDAIHAMSPALGVGANTALQDAAILSTQLGRTDGTPQSIVEQISHYETSMRDYGFTAVRASARNGVMLAGQDPLPDSFSADPSIVDGFALSVKEIEDL
ncbi:FAD-dependent oxidoreductase [Actinokineospora sp. HUAS TT18]|uniref:FAD-dependent oxidoreductase n=1 Tax=Actinokineospora sp. HUAS TT18 TaxID=3447451 RepID=UPI003F51E497